MGGHLGRWRGPGLLLLPPCLSHGRHRHLTVSLSQTSSSSSPCQPCVCHTTPPPACSQKGPVPAHTLHFHDRHTCHPSTSPALPCMPLPPSLLPHQQDRTVSFVFISFILGSPCMLSGHLHLYVCAFLFLVDMTSRTCCVALFVLFLPSASTLPPPSNNSLRTRTREFALYHPLPLLPSLSHLPNLHLELLFWKVHFVYMPLLPHAPHTHASTCIHA